MLDLFKNPPAQYRIAPLWFWNANPTIQEVERQIREMHVKGIGGCFIVESEEAASAEHWRECIEFAKALASELGMFASSYDNWLDIDSESAQLCPLNLYNSAQESAIGSFVDIPFAEAPFQALQINAGWADDISDAQILREKLGVSAAHSAGITRVLCTPFADTGWDLSPAQIKSTVDRAAVMGINLFCPRPFMYTTFKPGEADPLPSQFYQLTFWAHYRRFADYAARLSFALSQGSHKAQIALLNPIHTLEYEFAQDANGNPNRLTLDYLKSYCENLLKEHVDFDIVSEDSISRGLAVDQRLIIQDEEYEMLILPPCTCITHTAAMKIAEYVEDGGCILGTTLLPVRDADGEKHEEICQIFSRIFDTDPKALRENAVLENLIRRPVLSHNSSNILFYECADPSELAHGLRSMVSMGIKPEISIRRSGTECRDIIYHHRTMNDCEIYCFVNTSGSEREAKLSIRCEKVPYMLNPETGHISALSDCTQKGGRTLLLYNFQPHESLLVYFTNELILPAVQHKCESCYEIGLVDVWDFSVLGHNCITLPYWKLDDSIQLQTYKTYFSVEQAPEELFLIIPQSNSTDAHSVTVNGTPMDVSSGWISDINFKSIDITELVQRGSNEITLSWRDSSNYGFPLRARLMGSFSLDKSCSELMAPRKSVRSGSWTEHGYPFYSGTASYTQEIDIPQLLEKQRVLLRANSPANIVEFVVNGEKAGARLWPPFEIDITAFTKPGLNSIEIMVTNSSANMMLQEPRLSGLINGAHLIICS